MCSPLKGFLLIVPLKASRDSQRFRFWLRGVHFDSAVCCRPRSLTLRCVADRGVFQQSLITWLRGVLQTAELDSAVCCTPRSLTPRCVANRGVFQQSLITWLRRAVCNTPRSFLKIRISWQNRNRIRKYFSLFIRGPDWFESWKKLEVKNLMTHFV